MIASETRYRREELTAKRAWRAVEAIDRAVVDQAVCPECLALRGETCRGWEAEFPEARSPHMARMLQRDRELLKGFGA